MSKEKEYWFKYICPICHFDAFLILDDIKAADHSFDIKQVSHLLSWNDGTKPIDGKIFCQECGATLRHIDPMRIVKLKKPWHVHDKTNII